MSEWKAQFKRAMLDVIIEDGNPLQRQRHDTWILYNEVNALRERVQRSEIDYEASSYAESKWWTDGDSFNTGEEKVGIDAEIVLVGYEIIKFRYDGTVTDLIMAITR